MADGIAGNGKPRANQDDFVVGRDAVDQYFGSSGRSFTGAGDGALEQPVTGVGGGQVGRRGSDVTASVGDIIVTADPHQLDMIRHMTNYQWSAFFGRSGNHYNEFTAAWALSLQAPPVTLSLSMTPGGTIAQPRSLIGSSLLAGFAGPAPRNNWYQLSSDQRWAIASRMAATDTNRTIGGAALFGPVSAATAIVAPLVFGNSLLAQGGTAFLTSANGGVATRYATGQDISVESYAFDGAVGVATFGLGKGVGAGGSAISSRFASPIAESGVLNLTERGTLTNLFPEDAALLQGRARTLVQDDAGRYWLQSGGKRITPSGSYDFVTLPDGTVRVARTNSSSEFSTHLGLSGGGEVSYAGTIRFANRNTATRGSIRSWANDSGHYQPPSWLGGNSNLPPELFFPR